ncbi:hypothetical protein [Halobacterium salinarum]|uniref:hypothetical protein n=1 Tax=Halobacterium salinarum TaxID=2242 RepID=UPI002555DDCC|nr:hypothetical protein [Halobacterium salinarum]MDL0145128.1 hypothetical protein [Halobacterium salinarum]
MKLETVGREGFLKDVVVGSSGGVRKLYPHFSLVIYSGIGFHLKSRCGSRPILTWTHDLNRRLLSDIIFSVNETPNRFLEKLLVNVEALVPDVQEDGAG